MIGRGATRNPWIFRQIAARLGYGDAPEPSAEEGGDLVLDHFRTVIEREPPEEAIHKLRSFTRWYTQGLARGAEVRRQIGGLTEASSSSSWWPRPSPPTRRPRKVRCPSRRSRTRRAASRRREPPPPVAGSARAAAPRSAALPTPAADPGSARAGGGMTAAKTGPGRPRSRRSPTWPRSAARRCGSSTTWPRRRKSWGGELRPQDRPARAAGAGRPAPRPGGGRGRGAGAARRLQAAAAGGGQPLRARPRLDLLAGAGRHRRAGRAGAALFPPFVGPAAAGADHRGGRLALHRVAPAHQQPRRFPGRAARRPPPKKRPGAP